MPSCRQRETGASLEGETQAATTQESPNTSTLIIPTPVLRLASALENRSMNVTGTDSDGRQRLACVQAAARTALPWARRCRPAHPTPRTRCAGPRPTTRLAPLRPAPPRNVGPRRRPAAALLRAAQARLAYALAAAEPAPGPARAQGSWQHGSACGARRPCPGPASTAAAHACVCARAGPASGPPAPGSPWRAGPLAAGLGDHEPKMGVTSTTVKVTGRPSRSTASTLSVRPVGWRKVRGG